jgi:hypothetical protein
MDARTTSAVDFILHLAMLITNRDEVANSIKELSEKITECRAAVAEAEQREQQAQDRERDAEKREAAVAKREKAVTEREDQAQALLHRAEEAQTRLAAMKAELKTKMAA